MISAIVPSRQSGSVRPAALALLAITLVAGLLLHGWLNKDPGAEVAKSEARNVMDLTAILWADTPGRDFSSLTTRQALEDKLIPAPLLRHTGPPVRNAWGTEVEVHPYRVVEQGDAIMVRYRDLPQSACVALVMELAPSLYDIQVFRRSVMAGGRAVREDVTAACQGMGVTVDFIYQPEFIPGTAMARNN